MPLSTRVVDLDGSGAGTITVPPCFYAGADDAGTVVADYGGNVGVAPLTSGTMKVVEGQIVVTGAPNGAAALFFDFDL
jgi:hypothetical protein